MGAIMSAMSPSARPTTERHTTPAASRILYGLIYRNRRPNSSRFVKEIFDPSETPARTASLGTLRIARSIVKPLRPNQISLLGEVAMHDLGRVPAAVQRLVHRFRQHDRTMAPPGASKGDRQVALPFPDIVRNQIGQQALDAPQELSGLRKGADITGDARVAPRKLAQFGNEMRIRQKTHVKDEVGIRWNPVLVTETHQGNHHRPPVRFLKTVNDELAQLVNVKLARVDHHIGEL